MQRLARRDRQFRHAEQVARIGSFDWDRVNGKLHWSERHFRLWGLAPTAQAPHYGHFRRSIHPDDRADREAQVQHSLVSGTYDCRYRIVLPDGALHHSHTRGEVLFDAAGTAQRLIGTVQDVSTQREAEARLHTHEFVVNAIADPISVIDEQRVFHFVNDAWCRITGLAREQVIGQLPGASLQRVNRPEREEALQRCLDNLRLTLNATGDAIFASDALAPTESLQFFNQRTLEMWRIPAAQAGRPLRARQRLLRRRRPQSARSCCDMVIMGAANGDLLAHHVLTYAMVPAKS